MRVVPTSVRTRLTLWYTVALALPLIAFAIASYLIFSSTIGVRTDAFVGDALTVFSRELGSERRAGPDIESAIRRTLEEVRFREVDIVILNTTGAIVGRSAADAGDASVPDLDSVLARAGLAADASGLPRTVRTDGIPFRVLVRRLAVGNRSFFIAGVHPLAASEAMLKRIRRLFLIAIPLILACAATGASFLTRRSLRPVAAMAAHAAAIGASTLHERLPAGAEDELGELARVLNHLLDRLEKSFEQQRRFMTDASHELRTPSAIIRTEADVTLSRATRSEDEYRASLAVVQDASRRLARIVDDVFLIARADAGHLVPLPAPLYLDDLVRDTVRTVKPIADKRDIALEILDIVEVPLTGDADLLDSVILNLLDNAIKHSPAGASVRVSLRSSATHCQLSVVDAGPGIPAHLRERIFERFFRVDVARSRQESTLTSGAGLGLSICRRIVELHRGSLVVSDSRPGRTEFRVTLPLAAGSPPLTGPNA